MASQHLRGFVFLLTSNDVLATREQRQQLCRYRAADETEQADGGNGKPNGKQWVMNHHHHQACQHTDVIHKRYSLFHILVIVKFLVEDIFILQYGDSLLHFSIAFAQ